MEGLRRKWIICYSMFAPARTFVLYKDVVVTIASRWQPRTSYCLLGKKGFLDHPDVYYAFGC